MKSFFGLNENIAAALSYLVGPITGIAALVLERENKFVRFHALQSTLWFLFVWIVISTVGFVTSIITGIPLIGLVFRIALSPVDWLLRLVLIGSKIFLMFRAVTGSTFKLPFVGDVAWSQVNK